MVDKCRKKSLYYLSRDDVILTLAQSILDFQLTYHLHSGTK